MHDDQHETIGFIGIGTMGARMAMRLLDAGFEVLVWNRTPDRCDALVARGAEEVDSMPELVEACDILLLCLPDAAAVEEVVFGPEGIAGVADEEQLLVDLSGTDAAATRRFARELQAQSGAGWVDAPASGGPAAAAAGTLTIMAGGTEDDVERARPVLECLGRNVTHMGESGSGQLARACHQLLVGGSTLLLAEMIALAERAGLDAELLPAAFAGGLADSPLLRVLAPRMAVREYEPLIARLGDVEKDLETALAAAREVDASLPIGALAAQLLRQHRARAGNDADSTSIIELYSAE
jgi:3-hydroxyisobutyrate dehydrogenase